MNKGFFITVILFGIGLVFAIFVISIVGGDDIAAALNNLDPLWLLPVGVLLFLEIIVSTFRWKYILDSLGEKLPFMRLVPIWMAGNALNYLSPIALVGGEGVRVMMLKRRFNIDYHRGSASVLLDQIFNGLAVWPMVVFGFFIFTRHINPGDFDILIIGMGLFALFLFSFLFFLLFQALSKKPFVEPILTRFSLRDHKVSQFLIRMEEEVISFRSLGLRLFWNGFLISFIRQGIIFARTMFILAALGQGFVIKNTLIASTGIYMSYLLPVPLALGVQESSQAILSSVLGWGAGLGILFSQFYRASELALIFGGVVVLIKSFTASAVSADVSGKEKLKIKNIKSKF